MDPYQRAEQVGPATPAAEEHEIKVQTQSRIWTCVAFATTFLEENESNKIVLKAIGEAISRAVIIAESIKKKTAGLHQNTSIGTTDESEAWKPLEEDLSSETTHIRSLMTITLSKKELDTSSPGYQSPVADDLMNPLRELDNEGGSITEASDLNANRWDARWGDNRGCDAGRGRGRGRYQAFGRGYSGEICSDHGMENVHQESGNIREASDLSVNRGGDAGRGRGRGRYQAFQGRGRGYSGENGSDHGNISEASGLNVNSGWDAGRGRGRGRYQAFQGHRRGSNAEIGSDHGMETVHQQSGNISEACVKSSWDSWSGRGRGTYQAFQGRGRRGYGEIGSDHSMENVHQESGNTSESSDHSVGRGWDSGFGRGRGHERDQAFQGHGRRYTGEISHVHAENMHQESCGQDQSVNRGWDAGRERGFPGRGRGYSGEIHGGHGMENVHQESGIINRMSSASRGPDARNGCAARDSERGRGRAFQGQETGYSVEFSSGYPRKSTHSHSGNINGMPDLCLNRDWDARNDYAARGRGRGREQASQGRGRWHGVEFAAGYPVENLHQESGNINGVPNLSMDRVWDSRNGSAWRGRGLQRDQGFQGRGRGYTGEIGGDHGRQNMHQESGNMNIVPEYNAHRGKDARHGYTGRARGRGRNLALRAQGRAYNTEISDRYGWDNMRQESRGCGELDEQKEPATQEPDEQRQHLNNIGTPVSSQQVPLTIDNLLLDSTRLSFDSLGDEHISHIGSACGFIFSDSGVALLRLLERQRAKLGFT